MNEQQVARGRRAVDIVNGRWRPGMRVRIGSYWGRLAKKGDRLVRVYEHSGFVAAFPPAHNPPDVFLDVEDSATLGCLVALAREALGEPLAHVVPFRTHVSDPIFGGLIPAMWWAISTTADSTPKFFPSGDGPSWAMAGPAPEDAWLAALEAEGRQ